MNLKTYIDTIYKSNLINLINEKHFYYTCSEEENNSILTKAPDFPIKVIEDAYNDVRRNLKSDIIRIDKIIKYIKIVKYDQIMLAMFGDIEHRREYVDDLVDKQLAILRKRYDEVIVNGEHSIKWISVNPGKQFTGSFNPETMGVVEWYGEYLLKKINEK